MKSYSFLAILLLIISLSINAEITTDGSLGSRANLQGHDYLIGADLGQQHGGNLFHSFQDFNLNSLESATFSGPNTVQNILSRVTGGNPSNIDGLIRSTIPNADMYFLNPYGIMFGPNAKLDVQGSFHASTADYLRLGENGRFDARNPSDSILTVAPIASFGFLTDSPAKITVQDSILSVLKKETLSLIGGDLDINSNSPVMVNQPSFIALPNQPKLSSPSGQINLISAASKGEVVSNELGFLLSDQGGQITLNNSLIEVNGIAGGQIDIRGGKLIMRDSLLQASTLGPKNGQGITLDLQEAIDIKAEGVITISFDTFGQGDAGILTITTPQLEMTSAGILTKSVGKGQAGDIEIKANQMTFKEGGTIISSAIKEGGAGDITLKVADTLNLTGFYAGIVEDGIVGTLVNLPSGIRTFTQGSGQSGNIIIETTHLNMEKSKINASSQGQGNAGNIIITADQIRLNNGSGIQSNSSKKGNGGKIILNVAESLTIAGTRNIVLTVINSGRQFDDTPSTISNRSQFGSTGEAGQIVIKVPTLIMENSGVISTSTGGTRDGGELILTANSLKINSGARIESGSGFSSGGNVHTSSGQGGTLYLNIAENITISGDNSGIFSTTEGVGEGGNIHIETNQLTITNNGILTASSQGSGNAGNLTMQADIIHLTKQGRISAEATNAAGGNIVINTPNLLYLREGELTTSVGTGKGQGGDILIENPTFVVLNQGKIKAQADKGQGGNIRIVAEQFIKSPESLISASSKLGIDGEVNVDSPTVDMNAFLVVLPGGFVEAQLKQCTTEEIENPSRFKVDLTRDSAPPFEKFLKLEPTRIEQ
ncbi:filamentous hemagglutinin N-terminal domain-containing protein [Candidatus Parabeggiatoa sp. HSG14]|uniref:two-partner secretion domain-containing protein n=1 Tax=Candidatus Parabeggiatoa sp. HSG14 TaxID=3055593 RepID=UPI0025A848CD|nr:filamentous hemagglutinin N-terminal domain-containing protein [Thiotrichales bacterium HSG14]